MTAFWRTTKLRDMSPSQWESLCDGCGRCCLHKLRCDETDEVRHTDVACRLLDLETCGCKHYPDRHRYVPDCVSLTPDLLEEIDWLPPSCAYRLLRDGEDLPPWHHLVSGSRDGVHASGASVRGRVISERDAGPLERHIRAWPGEPPRPPRARPRIRRKSAATGARGD